MEEIRLSTTKNEQIIDITAQVERMVADEQDVLHSLSNIVPKDASGKAVPFASWTVRALMRKVRVQVVGVVGK